MMTTILHNGSVPVRVAARVYGKDACWVRAGLISGWLPIGVATRKGKQVTSINDMDSRKDNFKRLERMAVLKWKVM